MKSFALVFLTLAVSTTSGVMLTPPDQTAPLEMAQEQNQVDGMEPTSLAELTGGYP